MNGTVADADRSHPRHNGEAFGRSAVPSGSGRCSPAGRVRVDGKFFRLGAEKFHVKGVTYGPFRPNAAGQPLPEPEQMERDFCQLRELGANTLRVYHTPPRTLLDQAAAHGLKVFVDIPWSKHRCFLDYKADQKAAREAIRQAVRACRGHEAILAYSVANEIPPDVVRWHGPSRVERFLDELVHAAKYEDDPSLVTFASFPPTEYLHPCSVDFYTMNVYLHSREKFAAYLARLQNQADEKPLMLGEYGIDSLRNGEAEQAELVGMHLEEVFRGGLAGSCVFSFTDEWFTGGHEIADWAFGLVRRDRTPKPVFQRVAASFRGDPLPPLERYPRVSVVVCSYNGASTLEACLDSLGRLHYPDYEVLLVDDGSTDRTREIAARFPAVRYHYQRNKGLSVARNVGMDLADGEIIAYTDADCVADEEWLYFQVSKLLRSGAAAVGGPNLLPTHDGPVAACVSASPGTPAHILIDDEIAEHIPGCNMAFWADRLRSIGGFDPIYAKAGDDVDVCWRLQAQGDRIAYSPAGFVWHHRRSTVRAYLKQQKGYGEAEALLKRRHPDKFRGFRSDSSWVGRIYTRAGLGLTVGKPVIHYGRFATGLFQTLYSPTRLWWPLVALSLEWWLVICLLIGLAQVFHPTFLPMKPKITPDATPDEAFVAMLGSQMTNPLLILPIVMLVTTLSVAYLVAGQAQPPTHQRRWWSRLLITAMHIAQPLERAWARYRTRFRTIEIPEKIRELRRSWEERSSPLLRRQTLELWSEDGVGRLELLERLQAHAKKHRWNLRADPGWGPFDITFHGDRWCKVSLTTVTEDHGGGKLLTRVRLRLRATLFYNALMFFLWYVLMLGWFAAHRWELALIPLFAVIAWRLRAARRELNRTVVASVLAVAADLGMTVVGQPELLRRAATPPEPAPPPEPVPRPAPAPVPAAEVAPVPQPPVVPGPPLPVEV